MKPSLEHLTAMVWRTENPNYIILIKNKAGKDMDFSQFKVETRISDKPEKEPKALKKYYLLITPYLGTLLLIRVLDREDNNKEVFRLQTKPSKEEYWLKRIKQQYKPLEYDKQGN
jgi:hypothetical protein